MTNVAAILNRDSVGQSSSSLSIPIKNIHLPTNQPRKYFNAEKLAQLVTSVKEHGVLEPLLVRPLKNGEYELVAGERRLRAAKEAGLTEVPIIAKQLNNREAVHVALIENLQREDLNPIEETDAILDLLGLVLELNKEQVIALFYQAHHAKHRGQELGQNVLSQLDTVQQTMQEVGRFSIDSFRSSRLPLLKLPEDVLEVLRQGLLEYTKCQAIARVSDKKVRANLLNTAITEQLSLKDIKLEIQSLKAEDKQTPQNLLSQRCKDIGSRLQKSKVLDNSRNRSKIKKLWLSGN
ncbi:chromosome partitioning protein, ParB family, putative (plasmid) [Acaryochloris marina MBIC11017]|uniref:Chromosome partitioning protein, ParB family, putative n=1 Tax=Acaryochloris marina (strain MBIC 11017) TaxID=329726 RepID=A8ZKW3_ACAM1|nr:chromosome partitioning protein, ParB family, putative [Acaryochloris marina MBIC11017]